MEGEWKERKSGKKREGKEVNVDSEASEAEKVCGYIYIVNNSIFNIVLSIYLVK